MRAPSKRNTHNAPASIHSIPRLYIYIYTHTRSRKWSSVPQTDVIIREGGSNSRDYKRARVRESRVIKNNGRANAFNETNNGQVRARGREYEGSRECGSL